jgi:hypothetical protein
MLYEAKQKIECVNITEIDAIQGHGTERKTVRKKDMVSTFERCYSLQELNTNLEECPLLTGRSKLSSLLLRKLGVEQSRHIYFLITELSSGLNNSEELSTANKHRHRSI